MTLALTFAFSVYFSYWTCFLFLGYCLIRYFFGPRERSAKDFALLVGRFVVYIAIAYCIRAITAPVVETHISDVHARETFRHVSMIKDACATMIAGFGLDSYRHAVDWLIEYANEQ